ncbi:MAG TPA: 50S ribosomal protein L11 methyltransferase [Candidatus Binatus sp.]|nr:50S ribosomal protein L11 methyltransferase [Candidatus Binatus sp.]
MSLILDEHREYLIDRPRVSAFERAIAEVVRPGDVVLDLGSGTGILGLFALKAGASRVYAIDSSGLTQLAREIFAANGFADRVVCIKGLSTRVDLPEKVNVIVGDLIGRFGIDGGLVEYYADARHRMARPDVRTVPSTVDLFTVPVEAPETWAEVDFWKKSPAGFNFDRAYNIAVNTGHPVKYRPDQILGKPEVVATVDVSRDTAAILEGEASSVVRRSGTMHGIAGWFEARLSPSVTMSNSPLREDVINRRSVFFPVDPPTAVHAGDSVRVKMWISPPDTLVNWRVELADRDGTVRRKFSHSTFAGMLVCPEDLAKSRPDYVPKLTSWGMARRSVVNLCDGKRTLAQIEREVYELHRDLFASPKEASAFVYEVMVPYGTDG